MDVEGEKQGYAKDTPSQVPMYIYIGTYVHLHIFITIKIYPGNIKIYEATSIKLREEIPKSTMIVGD